MAACARPASRRQREGRAAASPGAACVGRRNSKAHIIGVVVKDTSIDTRIATDKVTENSWKYRPTMPPIARMGMKTATSDKLIDTTVNPTSRAPRKAARTGPRPRSM